MTGDPASVVSVVLNWNNYSDSARCLESLAELTYEPHTVLLVDNGSTDDSLERLRAEFPNVEYVANDANLGFSGGMNAGIGPALDRGADYVWLLNNDLVIPEADTLDRLVDRMEERTQLGALTPAVKQYPATDETWFLQGLVDWDSGNSRHEREVADASRWDGDVLYNDFVPFCSVLCRRDAFEDIGLLPEPYFLYREDVEFCGRLTDAGYTIGTDTAVETCHVGTGNSDGGLGGTITYYAARNRWLLRRRMSGRVSWIPFLRDYVRWSVLKLGMVSAAGETGGLVGWIRGTIDGIRGESGKGPYP